MLLPGMSTPRPMSSRNASRSSQIGQRLARWAQRTEKEDSSQAVDQGIYPLDRAHLPK